MSKPFIQNDAEEQLLLLRDLTKRFNVIHDAQALQLKLWPLVLFQDAKKADASLDMERKSISFDVIQPGKATKDFKEKCNLLADWVQWLLGTEWVIKVDLRGKNVYRRGAQLTETKK